MMRGFSHVGGVLAFSFSIEGKKDHIWFFFFFFFLLLLLFL